MQTKPPGQFPKSLNGIQIGAVGRKKIQGKVSPVLLPPVFMKIGMMISGIVRNDQDAPSGFGTDLPKIAHEGIESHSIESTLLSLKGEFAVAQSNGAEVADALARGMMKENRILFLRWNPHAATRSMLLEMNFVSRPKVNPGVRYPFCEFFYMPLEALDPPEQSEDGVCASGNRIP